MIDTKKQCKLDDSKAELYTIEECYNKVGKFPFTIMKMKVTTATGLFISLPIFTTRTITGKRSERFECTVAEIITDTRSWILLK